MLVKWIFIMEKVGWWLQAAFDGLFLFLVMDSSGILLGFPMDCQSVLVLHSLVFIMKMHSTHFTMDTSG